MEQFYLNILFASFVLLTFLGGYLCLGRIPQKPQFASYRRARIILGVCLFIWGLQFLLQWIFRFRDSAPHIASAVNISMYYYAAISFGMAYISLLKPTYINRKQIIRDLTPYTLVVVAMWGSIFLFSDKPVVRNITLYVAAAVFFLEAVRLAMLFYKTYRSAVKDMNSYYYDNVEQFVRWMHRSVIFIVILGTIGAILSFAPKWIISIYAFVGDIAFIFIYATVLNYMTHFEEVDSVVANNEQEDVSDTNTLNNQDMDAAKFKALGKAITKWIAKERYAIKGITATSITEELKTNRTYLTDYINNIYHCSLRDWINTLRIEKAKAIMKSDPSKTNDNISVMVGYSTRTHFSRIFTQIVGQTPSEWKKENLE